MEALTQIKQLEEEIEEALWSHEVAGDLDQALAAYRKVETRLEEFGLAPEHPAYSEQQRVLAYCLMRESNILRQRGKIQEALQLSEREITAARACGDDITLARSLMSNGTNHIAGGEIEKGLALVEEGRASFEKGDTYDHRQGLGWYWILRADLANARIVDQGPADAIEAASRALAILMPLENWPGVARAYAARAEAYRVLGDEGAVKSDRDAQVRYEQAASTASDAGAG